MNDKIKVDKENNFASVLINTKIYPAEVVLNSAQAFEQACWINVTGDPNSELKITLKPKEEDIDVNTLGNEFFNYILAAAKTKEESY